MKSTNGTTGPRTTSRRLRALRGLALAATGGLVLGGLATVNHSASAAEPDPSLKLLVRKGELVAYGNDRFAFTSLPMLAEAVGGDLDLRVSRTPGDDIVPGDPGSYAAPVTVRKVVGDTSTALPGATVNPDFWAGLEKFWHVKVTNPKGKVVVDDDMSFCPNTYDPQRIDPDSVDRNQFPTFCYGQAFTLGARYGLSSGWAAPATQDEGIGFPARLGRQFTITLSVNDAYKGLFGTNDTSASAVVTVKRQPRGEDYKTAAKQATRRGWASAGVSGRSAAPAADPVRRPSSVRTLRATDVPDTALPDLRSLPSSGIDTSRTGGKQYLNFGATVWVDGNSRLDIEGFRDNPAEPDEMTAYQYFYAGDTVIGKQQVGILEYHRGGGHNHWHLEYFADYDLLDASKAFIAKSGKQSFCLAPTDAVDLAREGADYLQEVEDLGSSCGSEDASWIRETLPVGWGDTYTQQKGGQAFDLTGVKPGVYYIRITANPAAEGSDTGALAELSESNNVSYRKIVINRRADGRKTVCVPAVDGLDAEGVGVRADGTCAVPTA